MRLRKSLEMGPSKEPRDPLRYYCKSGPTMKIWGTLMSLANKTMPEEQRLPLTMTKTDPKRSSPKGPPRPRQPQNVKLPHSLEMPKGLKLPQNFEPSQSL